MPLAAVVGAAVIAMPMLVPLSTSVQIGLLLALVSRLPTVNAVVDFSPCASVTAEGVTTGWSLLPVIVIVNVVDDVAFAVSFSVYVKVSVSVLPTPRACTAVFVLSSV